jgi:predicted metal-dependent phosphoesterase TrpH
MISPRLASACFLLVAIAAGTLSDTPVRPQPIALGGYRVLAADFHVHTFPLSAGTLAPWDVVLETRRQGLDAIAITGHNDTLAGKAGQWFSRRMGGPTVLVGEEIHAPDYHLIAVGIRTTVSWRRSAAQAIDDVHNQGGFAIAAHPVAEFWPGFDAEAMPKLDGAEVLQPIAYSSEATSRELEQFYGRAKLTAIGSSDYHGLGPVGLCRTLVFAHDDTEQGILDALRAGRTVVIDRGRAYGDPELIALALKDPRLNHPEASSSTGGFLAVLSRTCGIIGLIGISFFGFCYARMPLTTSPEIPVSRASRP